MYLEQPAIQVDSAVYIKTIEPICWLIDIILVLACFLFVWKMCEINDFYLQKKIKRSFDDCVLYVLGAVSTQGNCLFMSFATLEIH